MSATQLPHPATNADSYAYAMVMELRRLNDNVEVLIDAITEPVEDIDPSTDDVELKEPVEAKPAHRDALRPIADISSVIPGYDDMTADQIIDNLNERSISLSAREFVASYEAAHKNRVTVLNALK